MFSKKRFGQHFLRDHNIIRNIITKLQLQADQYVVEVGPGHGELTKFLVDQVFRLEVIEIDNDLIPALRELAAKYKNLHIHHMDVLKFDLSHLTKYKNSLRIVGNLPYNISTPLLFHFLKSKQWVKDIHIMLQEEVADRIIAKPGSKCYGRLSVMVQYHCEGEKLLHIPPSAFSPPPQVESAILRLLPYQTVPFVANNYSLFEGIVRNAFSQRRKMIKKVLKNWMDEKTFHDLHINPAARPEELAVSDYVKISNHLRASINEGK